MIVFIPVFLLLVENVVNCIKLSERMINVFSIFCIGLLFADR